MADGLKGIFICGTNGEGPSLTIAERMAVTEAYIKGVTDWPTIQRDYLLHRFGLMSGKGIIK